MTLVSPPGDGIAKRTHLAKNNDSKQEADDWWGTALASKSINQSITAFVASLGAQAVNMIPLGTPVLNHPLQLSQILSRFRGRSFYTPRPQVPG